jgi:hypothetical protein
MAATITVAASYTTSGDTIWPEASRAQNSMAVVSAEGSTVCVWMRRLNSSRVLVHGGSEPTA